MMRKIHLLLTLSIFLLSACVGSAEPTLLPGTNNENDGPAAPAASTPEAEAPAVEASETTAEPSEAIVTPEIEIPADAESIVELAITDLAQRLGIEISAIAIVLNKPITWPDATLGCPKPGMDFSPVETPGYILQLSVDGHIYTYHSDDVNRIILCPAEGEGPDEIFIMP
jgi:hypothetical protein